MSWYYRIGAFSVFLTYIVKAVNGNPLSTDYLIIGWLILILAEMCDLKESFNAQK